VVVVGDWKVSDGGIPEAIEEWLLNHGLEICYAKYAKQWVLCVSAGSDGEQYPFDWTLDRPPSLAKAILAVATGK
jgi:hypothetical protein